MKYWLGQVTHQDSRDGYEDYLVLPDDLTVEEINKLVKIASKNNWNIWEVTHLATRSDFDGIMKSITEGWDTHHIGDGLLADLTEWYEVGL
jgi:hypothetical protein